MVGPSKILTVSYGTFSCTLEGFDDPFSAMRGIAEYFRDLAADDRYFGAEPPTPDAEMLHKIAEREIQRHVEARVENGGIVLRQSRPAPAGIETGDGSDVHGTLAPAAPQLAPRTQTVASPTPRPASSRPRTESVAEKLARIRAATVEDEGLEGPLNAAPALGSLAAAFADEGAITPDQSAQNEAPENHDVQDEQARETVAPTAPEFAPEAEPEPAFLPDVDTAAQGPDATAQPAEMSEFDDGPAAHGVADDSDVLVLDPSEEVDLSDVDLDGDADATLDDNHVDLSALDFEEDDAANLPSDEDTIDLDGILTAAPETEDDLPSGDTTPDTDMPGMPEADFAALIAAENEAAEVEAAAQADEFAQDGQDDKTVARILKMRRTDFEAAAAQESQRAETVVIDPVDEALFAQADAVTTRAGDDDAQGFEPAVDGAFATEDHDGEPADLGEDLSPDFAPPLDETSDLRAGEATAAPSKPSGGLSKEDEAELLASLSRLETDDDDDDDFDDDPEEFSSVPIEEPRVASTSVERLFEVTNSEMAGRESSRRRSAIAHLKAAVAATRADREHSDEIAADPAQDDVDFDISAYREDLARVVRPKRPADTPNSGSRRMPPLMLVSEQRIDTITEEAVRDVTGEAVRPRRVASSDEDDHDEDDDSKDNIFGEAGSFAEFAADMGAHDLPDMLEAAAAYYSYVEGQPHFSRPQIMKAVAAIDEQGDFSREDGLRSFGQLLRHGKIHKIRRGQFEIDKSTRFRPQQLQVGA